MAVDPVTMSALMTLGGGGASLLGAKLSADAAKEAAKRKNAILEAQARAIENGWQVPKFDLEPMTYEEFKQLETFDPEIAAFVQEQAPQLVREGGARDAIRAEKEALSRLQDLSRTGETAIGRAQREMGATEAEAVGQQLRERALSELAASGQLRGGERILSETAAADEAAKRARESALMASAQEEQRRQQALGQVGSLASQMRQEEMSKERSNVDIANSFNQRLSMRRQAHLDQIAQTRNAATLENQRRKSETQQKNTTLRNYMREMERNRLDQMERERAASENQRLTTVANIRTGQQAEPVSNAGQAWSAGGNIAMQEGFKQGSKALFGEEKKDVE